MKNYVKVAATFEADGTIMPRAIYWEDGRRFAVDRVKDIRRAASLRSGGAGIRYVVMICGHERWLYLEESRWFIEPPGDGA